MASAALRSMVSLFVRRGGTQLWRVQGSSVGCQPWQPCVVDRVPYRGAERRSPTLGAGKKFSAYRYQHSYQHAEKFSGLREAAYSANLLPPRSPQGSHCSDKY